YPVSTGYGLVTHFYNVRSKMVPAQARRLCTIGDYLAMRLCGSSAPVMDASNAASLGLFDLRNREFDRDAVNKTGIDPSILPMLAGNDNPLVGRTGDGKPVFCAIGDNQASFIGAVAKAEDSLLVNVGTGSQISVYSNTYENIAGLDTRPFPGGGYLLVGASLSGGKSYELLERFFREICHAFTGLEMSDSALFEAMNRLAAASLEADEALPLVGTQFYGTRHKPDAAGTITGLNALNMR
ncbi:hypothetical protein K0U00_43945, partial [Paenibacillus sepulcri]|nr:hypothetical protein [Paenibacillus sepulcri]